MILDEIAEKARVRATESKHTISPDVMAEKAKQKAKATEPFRLYNKIARDGVSFICRCNFCFDGARLLFRQY